MLLRILDLETVGSYGIRVNPEDQSRYSNNLAKLSAWVFGEMNCGKSPPHFTCFGETSRAPDISQSLEFRRRVLMTRRQTTDGGKGCGVPGKSELRSCGAHLLPPDEHVTFDLKHRCG